ncbi:MAG: hypothetical protein MUF51_07010, partial [Vicinamibacteria bacterium]|nr:hypothetical protein [Vicinamibacteria bacterium]
VIMILPVSENADDTLRRIMRLYQYSWPIVTGMDARRAWGMATPALLLVARDGFVGVEMQAPLDAALGRILAMLRRDGAREQLPRPAWDGRAHEIPEWPRASRLLPEGLFTGAGDPAPDSYGRAVAAFRERRYLEAERLFDALGASGDGWLLAPEARFNRALCMRAAGHAAEARRILRSIGDAREQDAVDRAQDELRAR